MITQRYLERDGEKILFRVAIDDVAVFDILTSDPELARCRELLLGSLGADVESVRIGTFGPFEVTLRLDPDGKSATFFIDGPNVGSAFCGDQVAGAYLTRVEMLDALDQTKDFTVLSGAIARKRDDTPSDPPSEPERNEYVPD
jgi:hypothetical protein